MAKFPEHAYGDLGNRASQPALSYEHIKNVTKDFEVRRDLGNRASPVNRDHMKYPASKLSIWVNEASHERAIRSRNEGSALDLDEKQT